MKGSATYQAQALAVVLIVLVVGAIIALAMVSRSRKDATSTFEERKSSQSIESSDTILDLIKYIDLTEYLDDAPTPGSLCFGDLNPNPDICELTDKSRIMDILNISDPLELQEALACEQPIGPTDLRFRFERTEKVTGGYILSKDSSLSLYPDRDESSVCNSGYYQLYLSGDINTTRAIVTAVYYNESLQSFKPYDPSDTRGYCLSSTCPVDTTNTYGVGSWSTIGENAVILSPGSVGPSTQGPNTPYDLVEVRVHALNGEVNVLPSTEGQDVCIMTGPERVKVTTSLVCGGVHRAKEVEYPVDLGAPAIFDYTLFNGAGTLTLN